MDLLDTWLKTTVISSRSLYVLSIMVLTINSILKVSFQTEHSSSVKAWKWHCCLHSDSFLGFQTNIIIICYQWGLRVTLHLLFYLSNQSIKSSLTSWPSSSSSSSSSGQELSNSQNISTRFSQQYHELVLWHCPNKGDCLTVTVTINMVKGCLSVHLLQLIVLGCSIVGFENEKILEL